MRPAPASKDFGINQLRIVTTAASVFAFALVVWGGIVRINGAGMTCPDWPRCRGVWIPALDDPVVYEWVHRVGAPVLTLLIVATFIAAWRSRREVPDALRAAWIALGMIVAQIAAGWLTIKFANNPPSVSAHLIVGVATFATLALAALIAWRGGETRSSDRGTQVDEAAARGGAPVRWLALASGIATFGAIGVGGVMSAIGAGRACSGFPLCGGAGALNLAQRIHMDHRIVAYLAFALVVATFAGALARKDTPTDVTIAAGVALLLGLVQVVLGALTVASGLAPGLRSVHQANGALLAAALTGLTYLSFVRRERASAALPARAIVANYIALTKPKVMSLLLFTTLASMMMAKAGIPSIRLVMATLLGGALAAGSSGAINMYLDRDIDAKMKRTARRPIPSGAIPAGRALAFGLVLAVLSFGVFAGLVNLLAAGLAMTGIAYYVVIYTIWLKRTTPQNIVIGGAAGSIPPLVGWAAVTDHIGLTAVLLFAVIFVWTPPHFWALSLMAKGQYAQAGIPMLPVVRGDEETKRQILIYTIALVALTIVFVPLHVMGIVYLASALALNALFLYYALRVAREGSIRSERTLYSYSMMYLALLFVAMVVDRMLRGAGA